MTGRRSELGEFLKARRAEISPRAAGVTSAGTRRVPGLRREEVALLAAISTDYYTRIEQGRIQVSEPVLEAIAHVLQLGEDERGYMRELAGRDTTHPRRRSTQKVEPPAAAAARRPDDHPRRRPGPSDGRAGLELDGRCSRHRLRDRPAEAPQPGVARLRRTVGPGALPAVGERRAHVRGPAAARGRAGPGGPGGPGAGRPRGELSVRDEDFRRWWGAHHVETRSIGTKLYRHPVAGDLTLDWDTLTCATDPDQQLVAWTAEPGSPSHDGLRILASWAAEERQSV